MVGTEAVEVVDRLKGTCPVGREVEKEVVMGGVDVTLSKGTIPVTVVFAGAVVGGMGILGVNILGIESVVLKDELLTLNVGSVVTRGAMVGRDGRMEVGKGREAFRVSESPTEMLERFPSTDVTSGSPVIFSTDEAMLSTADTIGGRSGGTMFGTSVGPDVAVVVSELVYVALVPKTSPAGVLLAGLVATRGGSVVNSFGRTRSASGIGEVVIVPLIVEVTSSARSVEADELFVTDCVPLLPLTSVVDVPFRMSRSVRARLYS